MDSTEFAANVLLNLPFKANEQQVAVIAAMARFCAPGARQDSVFILNGYAGTGKTSITGALVRTLASVGLKSVLLAPTGRAAKVFAAFAGHPASTIHRRIYRHNSAGINTGGMPVQASNNASDTVFFVDEASMIGGPDSHGESLLHDLVQYVYAGVNCRLILLGDTAQLPPVGAEKSPAMNPDVLRSFGLKVTRATMTEPARQGRLSGILYNATMLRRMMLRPDGLGLPAIRFTNDVLAVSPEDLPEHIDRAYRSDGVSQTVVITRSNRTASDFNQGIRGQVLYYEDELLPDDLLAVAKNNYYWTRNTKGLDFVANGDTLVVRRIIATEQRYGFRFADVVLSPLDSELEFEAKIMLDTLRGDSAALPHARTEELYYAVMQDNSQWPEGMQMEQRLKQLKNNPYWCALQVKYAYAVTCHKAQGGQWQHVFVDMSYLPEDAASIELYRWLYTAVTRARKCLYIIGSQPD
ncbi:MAG: AAA family ATPase [Muribaculaceae bacterium]|nr:AAA family ATPase [Muribaculaceae bacterium]MDE6332804.1 AAA family ATPase [Muribaculaceae bacterium]